MKLECPKCKSPSSWLTKTETDLWHKCMCGYLRLLFTTLVDTLDGPLEDDPEDDPASKLPKMGTNLYKTLVVVSILPNCSSAEITARVNELNGVMKVPGKIMRLDQLLTVSDVSSYLTILRGKGLVERSEIKRGVAGGSKWYLTELAVEQLGLED